MPVAFTTPVSLDCTMTWLGPSPVVCVWWGVDHHQQQVIVGLKGAHLCPPRDVRHIQSERKWPQRMGQVRYVMAAGARARSTSTQLCESCRDAVQQVRCLYMVWQRCGPHSTRCTFHNMPRLASTHPLPKNSHSHGGTGSTRRPPPTLHDLDICRLHAAHSAVPARQVREHPVAPLELACAHPHATGQRPARVLGIM